jgi:cell volume regulation protein A
VAGIPNAETIFNVVFFVVLLSVLVQGTTIPTAATRLALTTNLPAANSYTFDAVIAGDEGHGLREATLASDASAVGQSIVGLRMPPGVLIVLLYRMGQILVPQGGTVLEAGDRVLLLAQEGSYEEVLPLFVGREREA